MQEPFAQALDPRRTTWHITWGTYGTRLHGGVAPTVDRQHNQYGEMFVTRDAERELAESQSMRHQAVNLTDDQRALVEHTIPPICERGGWSYRVAAAQVDHIHVLCDILPEVHGEKVRRLLKRWIGQALSEQWSLHDGERWWAVEGSNKAVKDRSYLNNAYRYILRQRFTSVD